MLLLPLLGVLSCVESSPAPDDTPELEPVELLAMQTPGAVLAGTLIGVEARGLDDGGEPPQLEVHRGGAVVASLGAVPGAGEGLSAEFRASQGLVTGLGFGSHPVDLVLRQGERASAPFPTYLEVVDGLPLALDAVAGGAVFRNDEVVLRGGGFIDAAEGVLQAELVGLFTPEAGAAQSVSVRLPVRPAERYSRDRGLLRLTTALGGIGPGRFVGTVELLASFPLGSAEVRSGPQPVTYEFGPPALFSIEPAAPVLGQVLTLTGGGFLGSPDEPDETTLLRLEGQIEDEFGSFIPFLAREAVVLASSGQRAAWGLEVEVRGLGLVSAFFGHRRATFRGNATVVVLRGTDEVEAEPLPVTLTLTGVRQVVVVSFLPGFHDSLRHYGLSSAAARVEQVTLDRMRAIYAPYNVDVRTEVPADFLGTEVARLELGGPDPNGLGLLGYDNTEGKDVGNVRLFDTIGGTNAAVQADGFPGYGGVFIDSFLYWSSHPDLEGERPFGTPEPDPLFDEIFEAVRQEPATLDEVNGIGDPQRVAAVERAVRALGSMSGETAAHELGHSLGLAQPYGEGDAFHSAVPGEGCLMDAGAERPLGERAAEPGYAETRFCGDEPGYLEEILPRN